MSGSAEDPEDKCTCCAEDVYSFQRGGFVCADQISSSSLHLLQLYRALCQFILKQLKTQQKHFKFNEIN